MAERIRERAGARWRSVLAPLLEIRHRPLRLEPPPDVTLVFTSVHGVQGYLAATPVRDRPALCVGMATAAAARAGGLSVTVGDGDSDSLAARILAAPPKGPIWHLAGRHRAGDLDGALRDAGHVVEVIELYDQVARPLPGVVRAALGTGAIAGVVLMSPRTSTLFAAELEDVAVASGCRAFCLSKAVAAPVAHLDLDLRIAELPTQEALLALL